LLTKLIIRGVINMPNPYRRRTDGDETWCRLKEWTKGQKSAERLASHILHSDGFKSIDPSHPLGGPDGLKDLICIKDNVKWIGAAYFPRGQKPFNDIKQKFEGDLKGVETNKVNGIVFVTNQELSLSERKSLTSCGKKHKVEIYHLERIVNLLNTPANYGVRLDFLDIELTKEEQLAFFAERDKNISKIGDTLEQLNADYRSFKEAILNKSFDFKERSEEEIIEAIDEFFDEVWYNRHLCLKYKIEKGLDTVDSEIWKGALESAKKIVKKYGKKNLGPYDDFEWGMINGKLSALRWVLGDEWDMLDT
jgi:hypothetical protein